MEHIFLKDREDLYVHFLPDIKKIFEFFEAYNCYLARDKVHQALIEATFESGSQQDDSYLELMELFYAKKLVSTQVIKEKLFQFFIERYSNLERSMKLKVLRLAAELDGLLFEN